MQVKVEYHLQGMMVKACAEDITRQNLRTDIQAVPLLDIEIEEVHFIEDPQLPRITVTGVNLEVQCHFGLAFLNPQKIEVLKRALKLLLIRTL